MIIEWHLLNFEQHFQKISNLFFGPFVADVEKLALVCFCFVYFLQNLRGWSNIYSDRSKLWLIQHWRNKDFMLTWTIIKDNNCSFFYHCEWLLRQLESGHFLTYGHSMSLHCRTPDLYWHFVIWLTSLKEIQTQFLSPILFVHVPQYS
jgi:hypothetical protein